ncbi:MAG: amino acid adenylation domain-containing protein [Ignavibacteria bacterium]|nr:amino acid adenylation domain-containing protein [Ignavibacteria bacterium]
MQSIKGAAAGFELDKDLSEQLQELSKRNEATLFMTLLAAFNILLYRYSSQKDICLGSPIAGRQQQEFEELIGFFVNTLALRSKINGEFTFDEFLKQVKVTTLEAYENQEAPFEKVVEAVVNQRDLSRSPLFQVMFILQNTPEVPELRLGELKLSTEIFESNISNFDLLFSIRESPAGLHGVVEYCTDLYNEKTITRMTDHFKQLLCSIVADPHKKIGMLPMLTKNEEHQLLEEFNDTAMLYPKEKSIVDLFEEQAARTPDNIALVYKEQEITYKELNERSNQLANYLNVKGVKPGTLVLICMERCIDLITGLLSILKSGGAYVPVDPQYPDERIKYMIEDTGALIAIAGKESRQKLSSAENIEIIETDSDMPEIIKQPADKPRISVKPHDLAYVIYTSGSTGRPKGTMVEHTSVVNLITWHNQAYCVTEKSRAASVLGLSFDAFGMDIWPFLSAGASVNIIDDDTRFSVSGLSSVFKSKRITHNIMPTALVQEFINESGQKLKSLEYLLTGGDKLPGIVMKGVPFKLVNNYGPTENTVVTTFYEVTEKDPYPIPPIGKPMSNTVVRILNEFNMMVPVGVPGEICAGGAGLARGYLNRKELTAEKFIADPYGKDPESRLYRTGDSGRWLPDGNIEFLGRLDEQVKVRGYRIEPGEIESVLQESDYVRQAVVLAVDDKEGNKRLAGYVVPEGAFDRDAIMDYLKTRLPEYMIPVLWVELENLPLTQNGKIDMKALPNPDLSRLTGSNYEPPESETERKLAKIWKDLLHIDRVGIHDNFFELGGHSLLAMRVISAIRNELKSEIAIKNLFRHPTLKGLAEHLDSQSKGILLPPIKIHPRSEPIPLSFSQERLWFIDRLDGSVQYHIPAVLRLKGKLNKDALAYGLRKIVNRHEVLRTVISENEGKGYQLIKDMDRWELQIADGTQLRDNSEALQKHIQELINAPFDLTADSMIRAHLISLEDNDHLLVVTMHHIASDGWSISLIVKEMAELYKAYDEDREANLLSLPVQYADYSIWQRTYLQGEILDKKLSYWKEKLQGAEPLELPSDFTRPAIQSTKGANEGFSIDKELTEELLELSKQHGSTLFMTLLSAFKALLYRYSGQQDICVGIPIAGRQQEEVEELIGFFINTLVLRSEVKGDASFTELLKQVRTTTLEAYENQDVPFEKVVEAVVKVRDQSRSPLFQVMFVFQNTPDVPVLHLGGVLLSLEGHEQTTAKFDLTVNMIETPEGLYGTFQYCTDLYREDTIKRMMTHYTELLRSMIKAPSKSIDSLTILTGSEENQLLVDFNPPIVNYPKDKTIIDLFEEQVSKTPDAAAVIFEQEKLTYKELNERSNRLAHYLQSKGVKAETLVPICIERGIEMITGILGILKAGAAYVPIDPEYPEERIRYILEDTKASIVLSSKKSSQGLPDSTEFTIISSDTDQLLINSQSSVNIGTYPKPGDLAYVIYTSGSTGKPKGVMIEHYSVVNLINAQSSYFNIISDERILQFSNYCFDASVEQIFLALLNGASLVLFKEGLQLNSEGFENLLNEEKITHLHATPSFLENLNPDHYKYLKRVIAGGDVCKKELSEKWKDKVSFYNEYGPTETTVTSIEYHADSIIEKTISLPIGRPVFNTAVYILDKNKRIVPIGIAGEIFISGAGLARGYLNGPELTKEKFTDNHFSKGRESKLYRTGDLGRYLPDGNIEYLGRIDEQVKIRGFRIELGEIENVLLQSELVDQVAVVAKEDKQGNRRLIGYAVAEGLFDKNAIVSYLKSRLPDYMVPSLWMKIDRFPLTSNGKIDKKALPDPDARELMNNEYEAPGDDLERALVGILQKLLDVKDIGINDNFFELGGHSLLALRFFDSIEKLTERKLALSTLFNSPTIKELAKIINDTGWTPPWKSLIPINPGGSRLPFFCVPPAGSTALHFQQLLKYISKDQPVYVLESIGMDGKEKPHTDLKEMAAFYVKEILSLQPKGPYLLGGRCFGGRVAFEMAQQLRQSGHKVALLAIFDTWPPFTAPPPEYIPQKRDAKHFITRSFHHMRKGRILQVAKNYSAFVFYKTMSGIKRKMEYILSDKQHRIYEEVKNLHFRAQDRYVAVKYPGKITLIECGAFNTESREKWKNLAEEGFETYTIPGTDHKTITMEPHVRLFAEKLNFVLEKTNNEIENKFQTNGEANKTFKEEEIETVV